MWRQPRPHMCRKVSLEVKRGVMPRDVLYPYAVSVKSILAKRYVNTHEGNCYIPDMNCEPSKSKWLAKGNPREMPHKSNSHCQESATQRLSLSLSLSLSLPVCLSTWTVLFFLLIKHCTSFTTFHLCGNSSLQSWRARTFVTDHWSNG